MPDSNTLLKKLEPSSCNRINLKPSRCLFIFKFFVITVAILGCLFSSLSFFLTLPLCVAILYYAFKDYKRSQLPQNMVKSINLDRSFLWEQVYKDGRRLSSKLIASYRTRLLIILILQPTTIRKKNYMVIPKDSVSERDYRKLCQKLWYG